MLILFTTGVGFTVMVNVMAVPVQLTPALVYVGVTVMVAVTGALVVFVAVKPGIFPTPLVANPIDELLFTQLNTTLLPPLPPFELVKFIAVVFAPLHNV